MDLLSVKSKKTLIPLSGGEISDLKPSFNRFFPTILVLAAATQGTLVTMINAIERSRTFPLQMTLFCSVVALELKRDLILCPSGCHVTEELFLKEIGSFKYHGVSFTATGQAVQELKAESSSSPNHPTLRLRDVAVRQRCT